MIMHHDHDVVLARLHLSSTGAQLVMTHQLRDTSAGSNNISCAHPRLRPSSGWQSDECSLQGVYQIW